MMDANDALDLLRKVPPFPFWKPEHVAEDSEGPPVLRTQGWNTQDNMDDISSIFRS
jgi:hypothetical protein